MTKKQIFSAVVLAMTLSAMMFLTFQDAQGTTQLSDAVWNRLGNAGLKTDPHELRAFAHIPEYFILGIAVLAFGKNFGWKIPLCVFICCLIGLMDESVKILIPDRDFDAVDLVTDAVGIAFAAGIFRLFEHFGKGRAKE